MPDLILSSGREAWREVKRLAERVAVLETEFTAVTEAWHAQANATNTALLRLEKIVRQLKERG